MLLITNNSLEGIIYLIKCQQCFITTLFSITHIKLINQHFWHKLCKTSIYIVLLQTSKKVIVQLQWKQSCILQDITRAKHRVYPSLLFTVGIITWRGNVTTCIPKMSWFYLKATWSMNCVNSLNAHIIWKILMRVLTIKYLTTVHYEYVNKI